ncbi:MAG: hypothetical protein Q8S36_10015 [Sulfuricurvum sp.]|nr:hypothetical protein [Sulfuricurvum sp.]
MQVSSYLFQSPYSQSVQVGRPDPMQEQKQAAEEASKSKEAEITKQNMQEKGETAAVGVKSSTMYQNDTSSQNTTQAVNAFLDVAKDVRRSGYISTYSNN